MTVSRDVTAQLEARRALEESEERFRSVFNNAAVGVVVADLDGVILNVNQAMSRFVGYAPAELVGRNVFTMLSLTAENPAGRMREAFAQGRLEEVANRDREFRRRDGQRVWGRVAVSVVCDDERAPQYAIAVVEDVTARHEVELALREATNTLAAVIRSAPVAIAVTDPDMNVKLWNPAAERLFGWQAEEVIGKPLPTVPPEAWPDAVAGLQSALGGEVVTGLEVKRVRKDGTVLDVSLSVAGVEDATGQVTEAVGMYMDITERKRTQAALSASLGALRQAMDGTVGAMAEVTEARDPYTAGHQRRVSRLAAAIAKGMELPEEQVAGIRVAGLVHDLGKISVPSEILSKPGRLSDIEFRLMQGHVQTSYEVLKGIRFPWPVAEMVLQHHERLDGSGYPAGLRGDRIALGAKILAVADVLEAMASHRPYRPALGPDAALEEIRAGAGVRYDPVVARACLAVLGSGFRFDD